MTKHKLLFIALVILLISAGIVVAQTSSNYIVHRSVTLSGGLSDSANYKVHSVIGQPITGVADCSNYQVSAGFLFPQPGAEPHVLSQSCLVWLPVIVK